MPSVAEHIDCIAAQTAGQLIAELYGATFRELPVVRQAEFLAEMVNHLRDYLTVELETAVGVLLATQPPPSEWAGQREFEAIVANNFPGA